jgi:uncharacterized C2H2 Zn-finger protein
VSTQVIPYNRTVHVETRIHLTTCCTCGVLFGYGEEYMRERERDHGWFYCPNGHAQHYSGDNTEEQLRKDLAAARRREQAAHADRERQREARLTAERQRAAAKGQLTKTKNRIAKGVCPCCNRTFQNLGKHMAGQHPDFAGGDA